MSTTGRTPEHLDRENDYGTWSDVVMQTTDRADLEEILEAIDEILEMDPDERFTRSAVHLHDVFFEDESFDDTVSEIDTSPVSRPMYREFDHVWNLFQSAVLKQLRRSRKNEEGNLLLSIYLERAQEGFLNADRRADAGEDVKRPLSTFIALSSRLLQLLFKEDVLEEEVEEMYRDVLRADYYLSQPSPLDIENPENLSLKNVKERVKLEAAVIAYREVELSVNRGAELAEVSRQTFEDALIKHDIQPRYGPESLDDILPGESHST